jgi:hypothetical protein
MIRLIGHEHRIPAVKEGYRRSGRSRHGPHEKIVPAAHVLKIWFAHMFTLSCRKEDSITFYDKKDYTICRGNMQVIVITSSKNPLLSFL